MKKTIKGLRAVFGMLAAAGIMAPAYASDYPDRPIRIILPLAAGSVTDVVLRAASPALSEALGQTVVIDNRPGASGIVGAEACAKAQPDGYTLCAVYHAIMSFNPYMFDKLPYDPDKSFTPVNRLFYVIEGLVVPASLPVKSVADLRDYAQKNPSKVNFATMGPGSMQELMVAWINREWKTQIVDVPYKGGGPIANAVTAGEVQAAQMGLGNFIGLIKAGKLRAIGLAADTTSSDLPGVPTIAQAGLGGFPSRPWWGIAAPAGTPAAVVERLNRAFTTVFQTAAMREMMVSRYIEEAVDTPAEFTAFLKKDRQAAGMLVELAREPKRQ